MIIDDILYGPLHETKGRYPLNIFIAPRNNIELNFKNIFVELFLKIFVKTKGQKLNSKVKNIQNHARIVQFISKGLWMNPKNIAVNFI